MKNEFIFSITEIFTSVLADANLERYYIGPYQRGYKWASSNYYDQVPQLLIDIYEAMQHEIGEYYLQYITVFENVGEKAYEVIDGQQRLTTLALIYGRLHAKDGNIPNLGADKLKYAREGCERLLSDLENLSEVKKEDCDTQDKYYIAGAVRCIDRFIELLKNHEKLSDFAKYLSGNVKLILNRENSTVTPEEVFVNLNGNSVALTNAYLIKGLLLTKNVRRSDHLGRPYDYAHLTEQRRTNGRLWDEIQNWVERPEVAHFFFGRSIREAKRGMEALLQLTYMAYQFEEVEKNTDELLQSFKADFHDSGTGGKQADSGYQLFNQFNEAVTDEAAGARWMDRLLHAYKRLRSLYEAPHTYNLLGYVLFGQEDRQGKAESRLDFLKDLLDKGEGEIIQALSRKALNVLPDTSHEKLSYKNDKLTPLLLAFNAFPESAAEGYKFNFPTYDYHQWSYEHIRPQNPKDELIIPEECQREIRQMAEEKLPDKDDAEKKQKEEVLRNIDEGKPLSTDSLPFLYSDLDDEALNSMGNMALLSREINSSLSNAPFVVKRMLVAQALRKGSFVPPHTAAVFTKSLLMPPSSKQFSTSLYVWDENDVAAHCEWMEHRVASLRNEFENLSKPEQ